MESYLIEFEGITCSGCITAVEEKLVNIEESNLNSIDKTTGNSILESSLLKLELQKDLASFQGCCSSCQISLKTITPLKDKVEGISLSSKDEYHLIKKQYKRALQRIIAKEEVACGEYCVCKTTDINRFEEFSEAPSFSSIFNLIDYLKKYDYLHSGMSIIDFGSGTGHDALQIAPLIVPGQITGIDVTSEMVDFAKKTAHSLKLKNAFFHQAGDLRLVIPESQDIIITNNVFNLLHDQLNFLSQAKSTLKPDGMLIIGDEFTIDPLPESLRNDPTFQCGGIADAQSIDHVITLCNEIGFKLQQEEVIRTYEIVYNKTKYYLKTGLLIFKKFKTEK